MYVTLEYIHNKEVWYSSHDKFLPQDNKPARSAQDRGLSFGPASTSSRPSTRSAAAQHARRATLNGFPAPLSRAGQTTPPEFAYRALNHREFAYNALKNNNMCKVFLLALYM